MLIRRALFLLGFLGTLSLASLEAGDLPAGPAYQIVLRSRHAEATPTRTKDAQTGGGSITVEQPEPNTIVVYMYGSAVAGSDCHMSAAAVDFVLDQELEIMPLRQGVRPPRVGMVGRVVGTIQVSPCGKLHKESGSAEQGPAAATLFIDEVPLLQTVVKPSSVACGQESSVNFRHGPVEAPAVVGCYRLHSTFRIAASQGKGVFNRRYAVADFDPAPELDAFWADALRPFRAVPRRDFGYRLVLRVVEQRADVGAGK